MRSPRRLDCVVRSQFTTSGAAKGYASFWIFRGRFRRGKRAIDVGNDAIQAALAIAYVHRHHATVSAHDDHVRYSFDAISVLHFVVIVVSMENIQLFQHARRLAEHFARLRVDRYDLHAVLASGPLNVVKYVKLLKAVCAPGSPELNY